jgi:hypothetical protein
VIRPSLLGDDTLPEPVTAALARDATGAHPDRIAALDPTAGFGRSHRLPTFLLYPDERLRAAQVSNADGGGQAQARLRSP